MTLYADLLNNQPKFTFEGHIGTMIVTFKSLNKPFNLISGDFITGFYCSAFSISCQSCNIHLWKSDSAGRGRGDRGRVPPPLQDGQVQHSEGEQGPGQQEVLQEVLNLNFPPLTVSPSPTQKAMSNKN